MPDVNNFTVIESIYGRFVVNRHCKFQAEALIKTGKPHIQDELNLLCAPAERLAASGLRFEGAKVPS